MINSKRDFSNEYNYKTINNLKNNFNEYLLESCKSRQIIEYQKVRVSIHPTKLTNREGKPLDKIYASDIGLENSIDENVAQNYYFKELFYDSDLEKENIITNVEEVVVFTKIPKNSIKIPIPGGKNYSPDFAYVLKHKKGHKTLHLVLETKGVNSEEQLRSEEFLKVKHATYLFNESNIPNFSIKFKTQFNNDSIYRIINSIYDKGTIDT